MLKSCQYCGRIHDSKMICAARKNQTRDNRKNRIRSMDNERVYKFRHGEDWKKKSIEIRERDRHCCQICLRGLYEPFRKYETDCISVHHISPIVEEWDRRLDNNNLITLCSRHHEMAESGLIKREELIKIVSEQEMGKGFY